MKLSFELTDIKKKEFDSYLYVEEQLNRTNDELYYTDKDHNRYSSLSERSEILTNALRSQAKMAAEAWHISVLEFINQLNEYSHNK